MNSSAREIFRRAFIALLLGLALTAFAQEPATPPAAPPAAAAPEAAKPVEPAKADAPAAVVEKPAPAPAVAPAPTPASAPVEKPAELRRLDTATPAVEPAKVETPEQPATVAPATEKQKPEATAPADKKGKKPSKKVTIRSPQLHKLNEFPMGDHVVPAGAKSGGEVVSVFGNSVVEGETNGEVVSVFGNTLINGRAGGEAVAVFGNLTINGHVNGEAVAVFGNITLGENAVVDGEVVAVFGRLQRHPHAEIRGSVQEIMPHVLIPGLGSVGTWFKSCLMLGRPLAFESGLGWVWLLAGAHLFLYLLFALVFGRGLVKCAETLEQHPGMSIVTALLALLLTPLVFLLLAITGVGLLLIPFLGAGLFFLGLFSRAAMHAWVGRLFTRFLPGPFGHVAFAVLLGGVVILLFYCVPVIGLLLHFLIGTLGMGMTIYAIILSMKKDKPAVAARPPAPAVAAMAPPMIPVVAPMNAGGEMSAQPFAAPAMTLPAPVSVAASLPRAGFWLRMGALAIDLILCGALLSLLSIPHLRTGSGTLLLLAATYGAVLWKLRGTTIGGTICNLRIVRLDDQPVDWTTAIVRALGCFLSLIVAGLGFIWIAIDNDKQAWHDKIAGTVGVRLPKGTPLV
ncbi:MAG: RDD family protein [Opitutae bacterium]|nr:RDD family protein [Opitutae bacterium]